MRTALISDIHGNYAGLLAVLADIEQQHCDRIVCLGDLVDGGSESMKVVRLIQEQGITTARGNHDEYPNEGLPPEIEDYLRQLPESTIEGQVIYTHTSPRSRRAKIIDGVEAWNVFEETKWTRIFVGDIHIPLVFGEHCVEKVSATAYPIPYCEELRFAAEDRYVVCVGVVGYSRDGYNWLRYAVYDDAQDTISFYAPEGPILVF